MISFICANDYDGRNTVNDIAQVLNVAKNGLYLTATQSIKKLRLKSDILSSFMQENLEDANFSIYSITEFVQNITRDTYASNKVLSLADSRYILCKVIEYQFKDDKTKYNMFYNMRYDVFELFRSLLFHEKILSDDAIRKIYHDFSCFEGDLFSLYKTYWTVLHNLLETIESGEKNINSSDIFGDNFIKDKIVPGIKLFTDKQKEKISKSLDNIDVLVIDGFLFLNDIQRYIVKTAHSKNVDIYIVVKTFENNTSNFIFEDNYKKLAEELGESVSIPFSEPNKYDSKTQLDYFRRIYPFSKVTKLNVGFDNSIKIISSFVNREAELRYVVSNISSRLKESYNGDLNCLINSVNSEFAIVTGVEKEKYQDRIENLFREIGVFVFKGAESLENAGYNNVDTSTIKDVYFSRNEFLNEKINGLNHSDKLTIFDKCFSRIKINKTVRPIATYPVGQFILEIYKIISQGISIEGFKTILYSNWKHTIDAKEPFWSKYISDFKYLEVFLENKTTLDEWDEAIESFINIKSSIEGNDLYEYHPINRIDSESLVFFRDMIRNLKDICGKLSSVSGSIEQHLEALKSLVSSADAILNASDEDLEYEQLIIKRIVNAIKDIGNNSLMNEISSTYFAQNIKYMITEWEKQNDEEPDNILKLNVVNLENMQDFKHTYFIMAEAEKYPRHYADKFPYNKEIMCILTDAQYGLNLSVGEVRGIKYHLQLERYLFKNVLDFTTESITITRSAKENSRHTSDSIYIKDIVATFGHEIIAESLTANNSNTTEIFAEHNSSLQFPIKDEYRLVELGTFKLCPKLYYHTHVGNGSGTYLNELQLKFYAEAIVFCDAFKKFMEYNLQNEMVYKKASADYKKAVIDACQESYDQNMCNFPFLNDYEIKDIKRNVFYKVMNYIENGKQYVKGSEITIIPHTNKKYQGDGYELIIEHDNRYVDYTNKTYRMSQNSMYLEFLMLKTSSGKSKLVHYKDMITALDNNDEKEDRINLMSRVVAKINIQFDSKRYANDGIVRTNQLVNEIVSYDFSNARAMESNYCSYCRFRDICVQK